MTQFDAAINQAVKQAKQVPVLINYNVGKNRFEKKLDTFDFTLIEKIENNDFSYWFPVDRMPEGFNTEQPKVSHGITHVHHFYTNRSLYILAALLTKVNQISHRATANICWFLFEQWVIGFSKLNRYSPHHYSQNNRNLSGTLYVGSQLLEVSPNYAFTGKLKRLIQVFKTSKINYNATVSLQSSSKTTNISNNTIDYIFTDPPFGGNLMYSELNLLWKAWHKVFSNNKTEAIENEAQGKSLWEYQELMTQCFQEYYRVLKHKHWMTVEFHNSKNSVWTAIQEALQRAKFVIADVRTLDKKQGTFKQVTSGGAVKQDLIISAYKPSSTLEEFFKIEAGTEKAVWEFVRTHLQQLPVFVSNEGQAAVVAERMHYLLFDRMVAFCIQRGVTVPISAAEFYAGLEQRFSKRDDMYFLDEQVPEYERKRMTVKEVLQLELFVTDESSAVQWLRQQLLKKPQTFQELQPQFLREIPGWSKSEKSLELSDLLNENFLCYKVTDTIPAQIVSWLKQSAIHREKIRKIEGEAFSDSGLDTSDPGLLSAAKDRYYIPNPNQASDLEKLREKGLLKEFEEYSQSKQKTLKVFRLEAVRAGFIGIEQGVLPLHPMLVWDLERERAAQGIYLIHQISSNQLIYKSLAVFSQPSTPPIPADLLRLLEGESVPIEAIALNDGRSFFEEWAEQRDLILSEKANVTQAVEWTELDQ